MAKLSLARYGMNGDQADNIEVDYETARNHADRDRARLIADDEHHSVALVVSAADLHSGSYRVREANLMAYTEEQRAIIQRIGDLSREFDVAAAANHAAQAAASRKVSELLGELITAVARSAEIVTLQKRHGDALRELIDTL